MADVFISYSRANSEFVQRLYASLIGRGREAWVDFEDIPFTADYWQEIKGGIETADAVIVVLSSHSTQSIICTFEIHYAISLNKRLIPLLVEDFDSETARRTLITNPLDEAATSILAKRDLKTVVQEAWNAVVFPNWIKLTNATAYNTAFEQLITTLDLDLEHTRDHTRLIVRSQEWDRMRRPPGYLLMGEALIAAETWLNRAQAEDKNPAPTPLQREFIAESRRTEDALQRRLRNLRRARIGLSLLAVMALIIIGITSYQVVQSQARIDDANLSLTQVGQEVDRQLDRVEAINLAVEANALANSGRISEALTTIRLAAELDAESPQVRNTLAEIALHPSTPLALTTTSDGIKEVAFSPDAQSVYFASFEGSLRRWDWSTGTQETEIIVPVDDLLALLPAEPRFPDSFAVFNFTLAADGTRFAIGTSNGDVFVYDLPTGDLQFLRSATERFWETEVAMSANGRIIAAGFDNDDLVIWENTGDAWEERLNTSIDTGLGFSDLALNADGTVLAVGGDTGGFVWRWRWQTEEPETLPLTGLGITWGLDISADGERVVVGSGNNTAHLWDASRSYQPHTILAEHTSTVVAAKFSPDGNYVVTGGIDEVARIWNSDSNGALLYTLLGPRDWVSALDVSADNRLIAAGSFDGTLRIWRLTHGAITEEYRPGNFPTLNGDGQYLLTESAVQSAGELIHWTSNEVIPHDMPFTTNQIIVDPARDLFVAADSFDLMFFSGVAGSPVTLGAFSAWAEASGVRADYAPSATSLTITADLSRLVLGMDEYVFLWQADEPETLTYMPQLQGLMKCMFSPDGQRIYAMQRGGGSTDSGAPLVVYDMERATLKPLAGLSLGVNDYALNADQSVLIAAGSDRVIYVIDLATGEQRHALRGHIGPVWHVSISADGTRAVSSGDDPVARVWDLESGTLIHTLPGHEGSVSAAISADGTRVITLSHAIREWQIYDSISALLEYMADNGILR